MTTARRAPQIFLGAHRPPLERFGVQLLAAIAAGMLFGAAQHFSWPTAAPARSPWLQDGGGLLNPSACATPAPCWAPESPAPPHATPAPVRP